MFLAVIALILLAGFLAYWQYTSPLANGNVTMPAETYAQNMIIWHQAAMLQVAQHNREYRCAAAADTTPCIIDLNDQIYSTSAPIGPLPDYPTTPIPSWLVTTSKPALNANWPKYQPLFIQSATTGWHSFLIRNYDLVNTPPITSTTQSWVITYYLPPPAVTTNTISTSAGVLSPDKLVDAIVKTNGERSGVGLLQCAVTATPCTQVQFVPRVAQNDGITTSAVMTSDKAISLPAETDTNNLGQLPVWAPSPRIIHDSNVLKGAAAILTQVQNGNE